LYRGHPSWVPPLRQIERQRWALRHNASLRGRWHARLLARRGNRVVGRIAAVLDPLFADRWAPGAGFVGFFDCEPDPEAASALLSGANRLLSTQSATTALGPVNLTTHDEVGLLVDGFDQPHSFLTNYNPRYYADYFESGGYRKYKDLFAYRLASDFTSSPTLERLMRVMRHRYVGGSALRIRPVSMKNWTQELRLVHDLYNACFGDLWGFVPLRWEEFRERASAFRPMLRPELGLIAQVNGVPAGFALGLPEFNHVLAGSDGRLLPLGWLRLARGIGRLRVVRLILLGVLPEHRGNGLAVLLGKKFVDQAIALGFEWGEASVVQETNAAMRHVIEVFGAVPFKTYRLYEKSLVPNASDSLPGDSGGVLNRFA
jgi:GNAT superfamily N-acetyltransferase